MASKEDILEQVVEDYLLHKGFFVRHNDKYRPNEHHPEFNKKTDSSRSDIDIIAINPNQPSPKNIWVVNCKSWQGGFRPLHWIDCIENTKKISGREAWKAFRELASDKWADAFLKKIISLTGSDRFTYVTAVTELKGNKQEWELYNPFISRINGNPIRVLTFQEIVSEIFGHLDTTLAQTEIGRLLQLFRAADIVPSSINKKNPK